MNTRSNIHLRNHLSWSLIIGAILDTCDRIMFDQLASISLTLLNLREAHQRRPMAEIEPTPSKQLLDQSCAWNSCEGRGHDAICMVHKRLSFSAPSICFYTIMGNHLRARNRNVESHSSRVSSESDYQAPRWSSKSGMNTSHLNPFHRRHFARFHSVPFCRSSCSAKILNPPVCKDNVRDLYDQLFTKLDYLQGS